MGVNQVYYGDSPLVDLTRDTVTPETLLQGETAHNAAGNPITGTARPESLLKDTVGWTGKNLLKNEASTWTTNGITWTVNDDGTILINGTNTDNSYLNVNNMNIDLDVDTEYILSGNTTENADEWYLSLFLQVGYEGMTNYQYIFNNNPTGVKFKLRDIIGESNLTSLRCYARVGIRHGAQTVDNVTFYPMIRRADITDSTYEPYHESVEVMYEEEIHGVNLFSNSISGLATSGGEVGTTNFLLVGGATAFYGKVQRNKNYTITKAGGDRFRVCLSNEVPANRVPCNIIANADGNSYTFNSGNYDYVYLLASMTSQTIDIIKPMLRKSDIEDSTYRPYNEQAIQNQLNAQGVLGAKNLLPQVEHANTTMTINGVTITSREDGSVLLNGTSTAAVPYHFIRLSNDANRKFIKQVAGKKVTISGTNVSNTNAKVQFWSTTTNVIADTTGKGTTFTIPSDLATTGDYNFAIYISRGVTVNNVVVYPMLRLASDPDDTYQPYAMTNRELTEKLIATNLTEVKNSLNSTYVASCGSCRYRVKNGICFLFISNIKFTSEAVGVVDFSILPNGILPKGLIPASTMLWNSTDSPLLLAAVRDSNEDIKIAVNGVTSENVNHTWYSGSLAYPIA